MSARRVVSGMRPTGALHLGHYHGVLKNWAALQREYDCFFFVADWHALTTHYEDPSIIARSTWDMVVDWLAAGVDPEQCKLFVQSRVPEHAELHLLLSMITPLGWLERVPTYKDQQEKLSERDLTMYGFLGYPVLQSADVLIYKAELVPVGEDQVAHLEVTREIARRFNHIYGTEPDVKLTEIPKVPGTDGRKMSKSYGNAIQLSDPSDVIRQKVRPMVTDPARKRRSDPGNPDVCPVFDLHKIFTPEADRQVVATNCRTAGWGCLDCKDVLLKHMLPPLENIRERRQTFVEKPDVVKDILMDGSRRARVVAQQTMKEVRDAVKLTP